MKKYRVYLGATAITAQASAIAAQAKKQAELETLVQQLLNK